MPTMRATNAVWPAVRESLTLLESDVATKQDTVE